MKKDIRTGVEFGDMCPVEGCQKLDLDCWLAYSRDTGYFSEENFLVVELIAILKKRFIFLYPIDLKQFVKGTNNV